MLINMLNKPKKSTLKQMFKYKLLSSKKMLLVIDKLSVNNNIFVIHLYFL